MFEIFIDTEEQFRFRFRALNGNVLCQSDPYETKKACQAAVMTMKKTATAAFIKDMTINHVPSTKES